MPHINIYDKSLPLETILTNSKSSESSEPRPILPPHLTINLLEAPPRPTGSSSLSQSKPRERPIFNVLELRKKVAQKPVNDMPPPAFNPRPNPNATCPDFIPISSCGELDSEDEQMDEEIVNTPSSSSQPHQQWQGWKLRYPKY